MSAIADLTAIVAKLEADVAAKFSAPPADDPAVVAAVASLTALDASIAPAAPAAPSA